MATVKKSLFGLSWGDSSKSNAQSDDVEVARKIATTPTVQEQLDRLRADFESQLNTLQADYEARFEALPKQFEFWLDTYTSPSQSFVEAVDKPDVSENLLRLHQVLNTLAGVMSHVEISRQLNNECERKFGYKLCTSSQISLVIKSVDFYSTTRQKAYPSMSKSRVRIALPLAEELLKSQGANIFSLPEKDTSLDGDSCPPAPEVTGNFKKLRWILRRLNRRYAFTQITRHINGLARQRNEEVFSPGSIGKLTKEVYTWHSRLNGWYPVVKKERLPTAIEAAYQLLTSAEQYKYNELFGAPK